VGAKKGQTQARGVCPDCGRTIAGRAFGPEKDAANRKYVVLGPHTKTVNQRHNTPCVVRGEFVKVPRVQAFSPGDSSSGSTIPK
jgi:hypothetical protein